ncbi:hypothetical protein MG290_03625 [Flavobacterium sp. CBA20B-1]|uniref:Uncharacterized protein n=1 Tax=Paenimyroides aestuarii TaxID=2968490 RepID=A0ABY5NRS8_9FLAO|nr:MULTISPECIES: hypothetical protein [Flavobacteriaceae]UUV21102.1 hypothetical protein NPX36_12355 [Paenimyroides aestuarii]WCM42783.1 hypothetical protein MG290_03625 [Flavobacterium sp. CBA20B-1]
MTFLEAIIAVVAVSMICFLVTVIVLANRKKFFRVITINTLLFVGYCFVAYHYETLFNKDVFGKGRIIFLLTCVFLHAVIALILVIKSERIYVPFLNENIDKKVEKPDDE